MSVANKLPPEVVVPRWYDDGLRLGELSVPVLVHTEQQYPTLMERLPQLQQSEIEELLNRWSMLRDALADSLELHHAEPTPDLVFLPGPDVDVIRITGWERQPVTIGQPDALTTTLMSRLQPAQPPSPPPNSELTACPPGHTEPTAAVTTLPVHVREPANNRLALIILIMTTLLIASIGVLIALIAA